MSKLFVNERNKFINERNKFFINEKNNSLKEYIQALIIVFALLLIYRIVQNTGILSGLNFNASQINFGVSFLVGLVASVSTCLAVVGAVVIGFAEKYQTKDKGFIKADLKPNLFFHIGRLSTFFVLGGFLGSIGGELNISGDALSIFTIFISLILLWLGLNILGVLPSIAVIGIRMPRKIIKYWNKLEESDHKAAPFFLGGLSFFLPCGFTQSMQIFALSSGSFLSSGLNLFFFALGTAPVLLGLGAVVSWTKNKNFSVFKKVAGILIIFFAIFTLRAGLATKGINTNIFGWLKETWQKTQNNAGTATSQLTSLQVVEMRITNWGFEPSAIKIKNNIPVRFIIKGESVTGCTSKLIIPSLGITKNISRGENIIQFTPQKPGTIPFSCWMGMVRGEFIVEP